MNDKEHIKHIIRGAMHDAYEHSANSADADDILMALEAAGYHIVGTGAIKPRPEPPQAFCCWQCSPGWPYMGCCTTCGNKRCPHANDHNNECTRSNEPGQPGSAYPKIFKEQA